MKTLAKTVAALLTIVALVKIFPDFVRYMKIRAM